MRLRALELAYDKVPGIGTFKETLATVSLASFFAEGLRPLATDWQRELLKLENGKMLTHPAFHGWHVGDTTAACHTILYQTLDQLADGLNAQLLRPVGTTAKELGLVNSRKVCTASFLKKNLRLLKSLYLVPAFSVRALREDFAIVDVVTDTRQRLVHKCRDDGWSGVLHAVFLPVVSTPQKGPAIRRAQWLARTCQSDKWRGAAPSPLLYFDGEEMHRFRSLDSLPGGLRSEFDTSGVATMAYHADLLCSPHWEAVHVLHPLAAQAMQTTGSDQPVDEPPREFLSLRPMHGFSNATVSPDVTPVPETAMPALWQRYITQDRLQWMQEGIYRDGDILLCRRAVPKPRCLGQSTIVRQLQLGIEPL